MRRVGEICLLRALILEMRQGVVKGPPTDRKGGEEGRLPKGNNPSMEPLPKLDLTTRRIEALVDGVFAIAMTVLVLNLRPPPADSPLTNAQLLKQLLADSPKFWNFVLSFLLLAIFWKVHHKHYHVIRRADQGLVWINVFMLMAVVLMPFSTSVYGEYHSLTTAAVLFELNLFLIGIFAFIQWAYATGSHRLVDKDLPAGVVRSGLYINLVVPILSIVAIGVAFYSPENSTMVYLLVPVINSRFRR